MKRIAAPMVGGMISSTILTLVVIPAIYALWRERELLLAQRASVAGAGDRIPVPVASRLAMGTATGNGQQGGQP